MDSGRCLVSDIDELTEECLLVVLFQHCDVLRKSAKAGGMLVDALDLASNNGSHQSEDVHVPKLLAVASGSGSPCIDFSQVSSELAALAKDADLVRAALTTILMPSNSLKR